jgi:hypothetical protein
VSVSKAVLALMAMMPAAISQQVAVGQAGGKAGARWRRHLRFKDVRSMCTAGLAWHAGRPGLPAISGASCPAAGEGPPAVRRVLTKEAPMMARSEVSSSSCSSSGTMQRNSLRTGACLC